MVIPVAHPNAGKPVNPAHYRSSYPFESRSLPIRGGLRLHYLEEGRGQPVLMVHGNPTWSFYFRHLVAELRPTHRVIVPDHIGCGLSDKPDENTYDFSLASRVTDLTTLMEKLLPPESSPPVTLVVHDWGGMIGLAWVAAHIERLGRLVITNTSGFFPPAGKPIPWRLRVIRRPNRLMEQLVLRANLFARGAAYMAPRRRLRGEARLGMLAPYNCPRNRLATLKFVQDIPLCAGDPGGAVVARVERMLPALQHVPTLILWGAHDFVFDRDYYQEWRRRLPHAEAHYFRNAGHYLLEDIPETAARLIKAFLKKHP